MIPQELVDKYNLKYNVNNGYIFAWATKGVYGLPQAGQNAYFSLVQHLEHYVYHPYKKTLGLQTHDNHPINFTLVVDGFFGKISWKSA